MWAERVGLQKLSDEAKTRCGFGLGEHQTRAHAVDTVWVWSDVTMPEAAWRTERPRGSHHFRKEAAPGLAEGLPH